MIIHKFQILLIFLCDCVVHTVHITRETEKFYHFMQMILDLVLLLQLQVLRRAPLCTTANLLHNFDLNMFSVIFFCLDCYFHSGGNAIALRCADSFHRFLQFHTIAATVECRTTTIGAPILVGRHRLLFRNQCPKNLYDSTDK